MTLFESMGMISAVAGLTFAYCAGEKAGGIGLWIGLVVGLFVAAFSYIGFYKLGKRLLGRADIDDSRRPTFREELPYIFFYLATWLGIFISTFLASLLARLAINYVST